MIGIYFLIRKRKIVYIGQTVMFPYRMMNHASKIEFDKVRFIECEKKNLCWYEGRLIRYFRPRFNISHNPDACKIRIDKDFYDHLQKKAKQNELPLTKYIEKGMSKISKYKDKELI